MPRFFMSASAHHIAIICNPQAGNGKALGVADRIINYLKQKEIAHSIFTAQWPQVWDGISQVWIVGGYVKHQ